MHFILNFFQQSSLILNLSWSCLVIFSCFCVTFPLCTSTACSSLHTFPPHLLCIRHISSACSQCFHQPIFSLSVRSSHSLTGTSPPASHTPCQFSLYFIPVFTSALRQDILLGLSVPCLWSSNKESGFWSCLPAVCNLVHPLCSIILTKPLYSKDYWFWGKWWITGD